MSQLPPRSRDDGLLLFTRYAFMPNRLGYCGGADARAAFESCAEAQPLPEVRAWARTFEGAYPYLALIARANGLPDPLDYRVVEAYWLGNELLDGVGLAPMADSLRERFAPRVSARTLDLLIGKAPAGAQPFHAFHVFDVCRRTGALSETIETLDRCRIGWGEVAAADDGHLLARVQPLVLKDGKLALAEARVERITRQVDGRGFVGRARPGDWISIHWGWACDVLTARQLVNLRRHTMRHITLANETL
jgi:hypothetical protein